MKPRNQSTTVPEQQCSVPECTIRKYAKGYCYIHWNRFRRHGSTDPRPKAEWKTSAIERFWKHVDKGEPDECWEWKRRRTSFGYGAFGVQNGKWEPAHRFSYTLHKGEIPSGLVVRHMCHNPPCVNPNHLEVGTSADNYYDSIRAGRMPVGDAHPFGRLSDELVAQVLSAGGTHTEIAEKFGVCSGYVGQLRRGEARKWLQAKLRKQAESDKLAVISKHDNQVRREALEEAAAWFYAHWEELDKHDIRAIPAALRSMAGAR